MDGKNVLIVAAIFVAWFSLNRWVLPWFGVATCMSGQCASIDFPGSSDPTMRSASMTTAARDTRGNKTAKEQKTMTELRDDNFYAEVLQSDQPVLVDFWAPWCGPCRKVGPIVEELATENAGRAKVAKVNVDQSPATAAEYGISSIPTLIVFKNGRPVDRLVGVQPKARLQAALDRALGQAEEAARPAAPARGVVR